MATEVVYSRKIRYSDTDAQAHVFNVNYFVYFDDAITDYMDLAVGSSHKEEGYDIFLAHDRNPLSQQDGHRRALPAFQPSVP